VDAARTLYNTGIVVSQDTVEELVPRREARPWAAGERRGWRFFDARVGKNILLEYVGDAKFKRVGRAIAMYRLDVDGGKGESAPTSPREA